MAKKIEISKEQFEDCILVATSSHSEVYDSVKKHFDGAYNAIRMNFLGEIGEKALDTNDDLKQSVVNAVCLGAFLEVVRHLDLVLTPTGFGVVANSEVSPASSARVEALIEQCRLANIKAQDLMLSHLCDIAGWGGHHAGSAEHTDSLVEHHRLLLSDKTGVHRIQGVDIQAGSHARG